MKGFRDFVLRGNVVDLAVAVVIGAAFTGLVSSLVKDLITPLIGAVIGEPRFDDMTFTVNGSAFTYGNFLNALITFLSVSAVVYFLVVKPLNELMERFMPAKPVDKVTRECPECLSDIPSAAHRCSFCTAQVGAAA